MKRSENNKALRELEAMCQKHCCYLPPFCHFTPEQWQTIGHEYDEVRDCMLGWDITDYGMGDFDKFGFSLIKYYFAYFIFQGFSYCIVGSVSDACFCKRAV